MVILHSYVSLPEGSHQYKFGLSSSCQTNLRLKISSGIVLPYWGISSSMYCEPRFQPTVWWNQFQGFEHSTKPGTAMYSGWLQNPNHQLKTVVNIPWFWMAFNHRWWVGFPPSGQLPPQAILAEGNHQPPSSGNEKTWLFIDDAPGKFYIFQHHPTSI